MFILLATSLLLTDANPNFLPPSSSMCIEIEKQLDKAREANVISTDEYYDILLRCYHA